MIILIGTQKILCERERPLVAKWSFNLNFHIQIKQSVKRKVLKQINDQDYREIEMRERERARERERSKTIIHWKIKF